MTIHPLVRTSMLLAALAAWAPGSWAADPPESGEENTPESAAEAHRVNLSQLRDRAAAMPLDQRRSIDKRIAATLERVNRDAAATGQTRLAAKLAPKFGLSVEALLDVKSERGFSWGELVVAQTLLSNSERPIDLADLATLRAEGLSWGALAYALGFHLEDLEDEIRSQGKIATGLSKR